MRLGKLQGESQKALNHFSWIAYSLLIQKLLACRPQDSASIGRSANVRTTDSSMSPSPPAIKIGRYPTGET